MEVISAKALSHLRFTPEPLSQWSDDIDLLKFLYKLHDKEEIMIIDGRRSSTKTPIEYTLDLYNRGLEDFQFLAEEFRTSAQNSIPARRAVTQEIEIPDFLNEPLFGKVAKYWIAWNAVTRWIKSESAFFSIDHLLESENDIKCSISLASNLFYKQAMQVLRSFLEEVLLPIHFCNNSRDFISWKSDNYRTSPLRDRYENGFPKEGLLSKLVVKGKITEEIKGEVSALYEEFNYYVHGSQTRLINRGSHKGMWEGQIFKRKDFDKWCDFLSKSLELGIQLLRINVNQWQSLKLEKQNQTLCPICHNHQKFDTKDIEFSEHSYVHYRCLQCGHEMTLNTANKLVYTVKVQGRPELTCLFEQNS